MGASLVKGGNVSLSAAGPGPGAVVVGLGWDVRARRASRLRPRRLRDARATPRAGAVRRALRVLRQPTSPDGSVRHTGDDLTGEGEGDDEQIEVDLGAVPADAVRVVFPVSIYDAERRRQRSGRSARVHPGRGPPGGAELVRYDLAEDASTETAMIFGELYRAGSDWKFRAVGQGYASGLRGIADDYGVHVG